MQRVSGAFMEANEHPSCSPARQIRANLPKPSSDRPAQGHTDGPAILQTLEISADLQPVVAVEPFQPITNRFTPSIGAIEDEWDLPGLNVAQRATSSHMHHK
jgi:hypothetical protein